MMGGRPASRWLVRGTCALAALGACTRVAPGEALEPVTVDVGAPDVLAPGPADATPGTTLDTAGSGPDGTDASPDAALAPNRAAPAVGGLWVVDANGVPIGVLVQRGHPGLTQGGGIDLLRDGVLVYSPKAALFFGLQMSSGRVLSPRLGVADTSCEEPVVAGYYTEGDAISGQGYAFVYASKWYRIADFKATQLVTCGGTVPDGPAPKCAPHNGSCRGFPIKSIAPGLPVEFAPPLAFSWLSTAP